MSATIGISDRLLPGKSRVEIIAGVTAAAGTLHGYTTTAPAQSTVMLTWRHRPTWAIILGIFGLVFLLLGALFFLVKDTDTITLTAIDDPAGVKVSAVGSGSQEMVEFLQGFLDPVT